MTTQTGYVCSNRNRLSALKAAHGPDGRPIVNGIDYLEVGSDQRTLRVHFAHPLPGAVHAVPPEPAPQLRPGNVLISGGVRIRDVRVLALAASGSVLTVTVDRPGDFSTYTLMLVGSAADPAPPPGFDPLLSQIEFSFKIACPTPFDCVPRILPGSAPAPGPVAHYLAKDYATFRQLLLDRLSVVIPDWKERNPADLQIALVELLAYVGDRLSYYQDAVAGEAYLGTARRRVSVRRHARLLDYFMHDGVNARVWVCLEVGEGTAADGAALPQGTPLLTRGKSDAVLVDPADLQTALDEGPCEVFETLHLRTLHSAQNRMAFYTWSDSGCCLPAGSTRATFRDPGTGLFLSPGDVLVFEEVLSPATGLAADADSQRRCAVRLVAARAAADPLNGQAVVEVEWDRGDALGFPFWLSADVEDAAGRRVTIEPTVARGNVVLADHGRTLEDQPLVPPRTPLDGPYRPRLPGAELTFQAPYDAAGAAAGAMKSDVRAARPVVSLQGDGGTWSVRYDLLSSDAFAREFVVETESAGPASLRFGDGSAGKRPSPEAAFTARYRTGSGRRGNVGAEAVARAVWARSGVSRVRNPLPAAGGVEPESIDEVRQFAPHAFRVQERAVTEADYADAAGRVDGVQRAAASFRWTGSWYTSFLTIDREGGLSVDPVFKSAVARQVERYRMAGVDLAVVPPVNVPLDIAMIVCVRAGYFRADVHETLLRVFSSKDLPGGLRGFFHPDNFTFAQPVYLSRIYRAAAQVAGVAAVEVTPFRRWGQTSNFELESGVLRVADLEIVQLANDPNAPESGRLEFVMAGGL